MGVDRVTQAATETGRQINLVGLQLPLPVCGFFARGFFTGRARRRVGRGSDVLDHRWWSLPVLDAHLVAGVHTGQQLVDRVGDDRTAIAALEPRDQAQTSGRAAHFVPRQPHAVGLADLGMALVAGQLVRGDHKLLQRFLQRRIDLVRVPTIASAL